MRTAIGVEIAAAPRRVFELARDVTRWPHLLPHYRAVAVVRRDGDRLVARMSAVRPLGPLRIPVTWSAEQWAEPADESDLRLRFRHVRGFTRGMDVTWHIRPNGDGASVSIEHDFSRRLPLLGPSVLPWFVDRLVVRAIAGRTLATFRALAERPG